MVVHTTFGTVCVYAAPWSPSSHLHFNYLLFTLPLTHSGLEYESGEEELWRLMANRGVGRTILNQRLRMK